MEKESVEMKPKLIDFRPDQMAFFKVHRKQTGVCANHFIRVAVDKEIQRIETEQQKISNYQKP